MKKIFALGAALMMATPSFAGNIDTFVAPEPVEPVMEEAAPMGGSNAAWIVPVLAVAAIALVVAND